MSEKLEIYFPLRSNGSWFTEGSAKNELVRRLKTSLVLYDTLLFEDGRFQMRIWETGQTGTYMPGDQYPGDRTTIRYYAPGVQSSVQVSTKPDRDFKAVISGPLVDAYEVDYFPLLHEAQLLDFDFIKWQDNPLNERGKKELKRRTESDLGGEDVWQPDLNPFQRKAIIESAHHDSLVSFSRGMPFFADHKIGTFLTKRGTALQDSDWYRVLNQAFLESLPTFAFPDFASMSWEELVRIRESGAGKSFREMIQRLSIRLSSMLSDDVPDDEMDNISRDLFMAELIEEIKSNHPSVTNALVSFGINLVPYLGWASSTAELINAIESNRSWISLLK